MNNYNIEEINEFQGCYYKGKELEITYRSPVDM